MSRRRHAERVEASAGAPPSSAPGQRPPPASPTVPAKVVVEDPVKRTDAVGATRFRVKAFTGWSRNSGQGRAIPNTRPPQPGPAPVERGTYAAAGGSVATLTLGQLVDAHVFGWDAIKRMREAGVVLEPAA